MRALSLIIAALVLTGCKAAFEMNVGGGDPKAAVAAAAQEWSDALNKCDAAKAAQLYAPDAVLWGTTSQALISTPEGIRQYFEKVCAAANPPKVAFGEHLIRVYGDTAIDSGPYTFTVIRDGKPVQLPGRYTLAYRKVGSRWLIVDHHSSLRPAAPK